jgi:hypothetical protein
VRGQIKVHLFSKRERVEEKIHSHFLNGEIFFSLLSLIQRFLLAEFILLTSFKPLVREMYTFTVIFDKVFNFICTTQHLCENKNWIGA